MLLMLRNSIDMQDVQYLLVPPIVASSADDSRQRWLKRTNSTRSSGLCKGPSVAVSYLQCRH
ncbi:uncharacterized protein BO87DRAFT_379896 [Aspergillus neoniger CBS 115656]|uniref:Uncharacterized protein n=1 Tax=Aspergillus neoniger (strain CBS 115656) TaxID=1448310 RepID=A0A318Y935_ASPNB|nr:hypothetical protein BO87DRAFT_379896 [Aspergillus neoniger CBS 115656]PYH30464.1 hypothetical protein BO87DRAFT_379896 [Aspergillus neoniger CBS 115656]